MKANQLAEVMSKLDPTKRIKFKNSAGWGSSTMAINAIIEQGNTYILIWACHPYCIQQDLVEGQKLVWYNPNNHASELVKKFFPYYVSI
jgi:PP-loop superfamily ATP-utilizing enzyme